MRENKQDKYRAEGEAKLLQFGKSIAKLEREAEQQQEKFDGPRRAQIVHAKQQKARAEAKLQQIIHSPEEKRPPLWQELRKYLQDLDDNLREVFSYIAY